MKHTRVATALFALTAFTFGQQPSPKTAPVPVHGQGCVASGVEAGCLMVKDSGSGVLYNLLISGMHPKVGEGIEFTGIPHDGPTVCMQGIAVKVTQWAQKDSIKCPSNETPDKGSSKP
jgi:hypothetical protein